jgi:serine/threonine protein kinase
VKPENVLVKDAAFPDVVLADLGSAFIAPPAGADSYGEARGTTAAYVQSRFYRAPEVIMRLTPEIEGGGPVNATGGKSAEAELALSRRERSRRGDYTGAVDVWSVAAMLPELRTGSPSFAGESEKDQLHCIAEVLGVPPAPLVQRCPAERRREFFTEDGEFRVHMTAAGVLREPGSRSFAELSRARKDKDEFCSFLQACLRWQSRERPTPEQALCLPWLSLRPSVGLDAGVQEMR